MANNEHFNILKQGVDVWNNWLLENPEIVPDLSKINLIDADLSDINLKKADLQFSNFGNVNLSCSDLREAYLAGAKFSGSYLRKANLSHANLNGAFVGVNDLTGVSLRNARLILTNITGSLLNNADLSNASLGGIHIRNTDLDGAIFNNVRLQNSSFENVDLSVVRDLKTVIHEGPSTIGVDTIYRSKGKLPIEFLRGCGTPESLIKFIRSLSLSKSIDFQSCFISYSSKDQKFAEKIYRDLQENGVRCWYAPEDVKIGDKIRSSIDENIRMHDKLLLILSSNSIDSNWVEKEVETAFEEETKRKETILVPIRLDDAVMNTDKAWAADIRRIRNVGDFSLWTNKDVYQGVLDKLLQVLRI